MVNPALILLLALASGDWACTQGDNGLWQCDPERGKPLQPPARIQPSTSTGVEAPVEPAVTEPSTAVPPAEPAPANPPVTGSSPRYVVQVGAYRDLARAQDAAARLDITSLRVVETARNGERWYILLLGAYADKLTAMEAGEAFLAGHPDGNYWLRTASSVEAALPQADATTD